MVDLEQLEKICGADEPWFYKHGTSLLEDDLLVHVSTGSKVLGVAHVDTAFSDDSFVVSSEIGRVWSARLDNRLGVYILMAMLPKMGVTTDVLLTTGNFAEVSTADSFFTANEYNWIYSFDLSRTGVAMYRYGNERHLARLHRHGLYPREDDGYADISELWFLGATGFNFGNGIVTPNSQYSSVLLRVLERQVRKVAAFIRAYSHIPLPYEPSEDDLEAYQELLVERSGHAPDDGPADEFDFSYLEPTRTWDTCDYCGALFHAEELIHVPRIGDGVFLCAKCVEITNLGFYSL